MDDEERRRAYRNSWVQVRQSYEGEFMATESTLQAVLYGALRANLPPSIDIVAEPTWTVDSRTCYPDLVLVEEGAITDIFELKYQPHSWPQWRKDIDKLCSYVAVVAPRYPVRMDPKTGKYTDPLAVWAGCRLHFVAVAHYNAAAVSRLPIPPPSPPKSMSINQWFGRVGGDGTWSIYFA